jgi:hypothetical protein
MPVVTVPLYSLPPTCGILVAILQHLSKLSRIVLGKGSYGRSPGIPRVIRYNRAKLKTSVLTVCIYINHAALIKFMKCPPSYGELGLCFSIC